MIVRAVDRNDSWLPRECLVEIRDVCPKCGGPRGEPMISEFFLAGGLYQEHWWVNPCGHIDQPEDILREGAPVDQDQFEDL